MRKSNHIVKSFLGMFVLLLGMKSLTFAQCDATIFCAPDPSDPNKNYKCCEQFYDTYGYPDNNASSPS